MPINNKNKARRFRLSLTVRTVLGVLILMAVFCSVSMMIGSRLHNYTQVRRYETDTWQLARTIAVMLDGAGTVSFIDQVRDVYENIPDELIDEINRDESILSEWYSDPSEDEEAIAKISRLTDEYSGLLTEYNQYFKDVANEEFFRAERILPAVAKENDVFSIHIFIVDAKRQQSISVFYGYQDEDPDLLPTDAAGTVTTFYDGFADYIKNGSKGRFSINYSSDIKYGDYFSSIAPYYHPDTGEIIAYVEVLDSWDSVEEDRSRFARQYLLAIFLAACAVAVIMCLVTRQVLVRPIMQLAKAANAYSEGAGKLGESHFGNLKIHTGDEIEVLANAMTNMEQELISYVAELTTTTARSERIHTELNIAAKIQLALLPKTFPPFPEHTEFDLYASMVPARQVGGDFYDLYLIDDDHLGLTIADVSGKGIPAAIYMVLVKTMLKDIALLGGTPSGILEAVNRRLNASDTSNMFCTVWLGILTISTGELICANAGHENPALCRKDGQFESVITKHGIVLGVLEEAVYKDEHYVLAPGDTLFLYTDGVTEAKASDRSLFTEKRLIQTLNEIGPRTGAKELLEQVTASVTAFAGEEPQFDDMTMLCLKISEEQNI